MKKYLTKILIFKTTILVVLFVLSNIVIQAQEIKVRSIVQLTTDISARSAARMDANNKECAIVRVNIPSPKKMDFGNAIVGEVEYNAGEYLLYVPEGTTRIPLSVVGYKNSMIDFSEYNISVMSKNVYRVTLGIDNNKVVAHGRYGGIKITTEPKSSFVLMDGMPIGETSLMLHDVPVGQHILSFPNVSGYSLPDQTIAIAENETLEVHYTLNENTDALDWTEEIPFFQQVSDGDWTAPVKYKVIEENGERGIQDFWGNWIIPCGEYDFFDIIPCGESEYLNDDIIMVGHKVDGEIQVGIYKPHKGIIIPCNYSNIIVYGNLFQVCKDGKWGLLKISGEEVVPCIYKGVWVYRDENVIVVEDNASGYYGLIDMDGNTISEPKYKAIESFSDGMACAKELVGDNINYYIINNKGQVVMPLNPNYHSSMWTVGSHDKSHTNNLWCFCREDENGHIVYGVLNNDCNKELLPFVYRDISYIGNGWIELKNRDDWVVVDKNEHIYKGNTEEDGDAYFVVDQYLCIEKNGKCGLLDWDGNSVLPFEYESIYDTDGCIIAYVDERHTIFDKCFNEKLSFEGSESLWIIAIKDDIILLKDTESERYGFMNMKGEILAGCLFDSKRIDERYNDRRPDILICHGLGILCIGDRCGLINKEGKMVVPLIYSFILPFEDGAVYGLKPDGTWVDLKIEEYNK